MTLEEYLKDNATVKAARKKYDQARAAYSQLKGATVPPGSGATAEQVKTRLVTLQEELDKAQRQLADAEQKASAYFAKNQTTINKKAERKATADLQSKLDNAIRYRQQLIDQNLPTFVIDGEIAGLNAQINKTGQFAPPPVGAAEERRPSMAPTPFDLNGYVAQVSQMIATAGEGIASMTPEQRLDLSTRLKEAGYKVEPSANYSGELRDAYTQALQETIVRSRDFKREYGVEELLSAQKAEGAGGDAASTSLTYTDFTGSNAAGTINASFQSLLGRDATPKEITSISKKVKGILDKNPGKTVYEKDASGRTITRTTPGVNVGQVLSEIIKTLPEFEKRKAGERGLIEQNLSASARANGLDITKDFGAKTVEGWINRIANGEKEEVFTNLIRQTAKIGMPDNVKKMVDDGLDLETIYAPYKRVMAGTLEVDPASISLDDPTLRGAITPEGEVPIYNFQRLLRKDPRWEYTNNARDEVAQITQRILKDFGFQG
jgi:hypothetical protein